MRDYIIVMTSINCLEEASLSIYLLAGFEHR